MPLLALMTSLVALSIDAMLPALPHIAADLHVEAVNDQQLVITSLFLGLGFAQLIYGPLSDSIGRKRAIYIGYVIFMIGCLFSIFARNFEMMLLGRVLQGGGAASARTVCIALVRDQYEGREMARIMSFVMGVFILVPIVAPAMGQGILVIFHWRAIFVMFLLLAIISCLWFAIRQPESLPRQHRVRFSASVIWSGVRQTCRNRIAFGYTLIMGLIFGAFVGYLSSVQQVFSDIYSVIDQFPLYFATLALSIGLASILNGRLVMKMGMRRLVSYSLISMTVISIGFFLYSLQVGGTPALWQTMGYFISAFLCFGIMFGNLNALAMEPLGHIAGVGAAVIGSISTLISVLLGWIIGQMFDGTVLPLVGGYASLGLISIGLMRWIELSRKQVSLTVNSAS